MTDRAQAEADQGAGQMDQATEQVRLPLVADPEAAAGLPAKPPLDDPAVQS